MNRYYWATAGLILLQAGCPTHSNERYCDATKPCANASQRCDLTKNECVSMTSLVDMAVPVEGDMAVPVGTDLAGVDLSGLDQSVVPGPDLAGVDMAGVILDMGNGPDLAVTLDMAPVIECTVANVAANCTDPAKPICGSDNKCRACADSNDNPQCSAHNASFVCRTIGVSASLAGHCVQCNSNTECLALPGPSPQPTPVCNVPTGVCRGCVAHTAAECSSLVCNITAALTGNAGGTCVDPNDVMYFDNRNGSCTGTSGHTGNQDNPYCDFDSAGATYTQASSSNLRHYVHYAASPTAYLPFLIQPAQANAGAGKYYLTIVGAGDIRSPFPNPSPSPVPARINGTLTGGFSAIEVDSPANLDVRVSLDNLDLIGAAHDRLGPAADKSGLVCARNMGSIALSVRSSSIHDSGNFGIDSSACALTVLTSTISNNENDGINITQGSFTIDTTAVVGNNGFGIGFSNTNGPNPYAISNCFIVGNASRGLSFAQDGTGVFQFNTVAKNGGTQDLYGAMDCNTGLFRRIEASILWGNSTHNNNQAKSNCIFLDVVTGSNDTSGIALDPSFVKSGSAPYDFHLVANAPANTTCCVDKVLGPLDGGTSVLPDHDFDNQHRPIGAGWDTGGDEVQ